MSPKALALVTARGGSKGLIGKNIRVFLGKPLIAWSIEAARAASSVERVIVTTDSEEIAAISREFGAETPFIRPSHLAEDSTPDLPVFEHALGWLDEREGYRPDIVVHLRPTAPLRPAGLVDDGVHLLANDRLADSVRAVCVPQNNPFKMWSIAADGALTPLISLDMPEPYNQPRQNLPPTYWQTGTLDVTRASTVLVKKSMTGDRILPLLIDSAIAMDIDDEPSWRLAESTFLRHTGGAP
jgi:CMP-N-acetylneuraminic acid synthetase